MVSEATNALTIEAAPQSEQPGERREQPVRLRSLATAVPAHRYSQSKVYNLMTQHFPAYRKPLVKQIFESSGIDSRHFVLDEDKFNPNPTPDEFHALFRAAAPELAKRAAERALQQAAVSPRDIGMIVAATCTGYLCPGLSVYLARDLKVGHQVQRSDLVGMGCAGAMPALQRAWDYVRAAPDRQALVVTVEICSACWFTDQSLETVVGNAICADGAAAMVVDNTGQGREKSDLTHCTTALHHRAEPASPLPQVLDFETLLEPAWMDEVGLENRGGRYRIVLSKRLRHMAGPVSMRAVDSLLGRHQLDRSEIQHWVFHAGGRAVLDSIDQSLGFGPNELAPSREVLRGHGNMSSPTVLFVLDEIQRTRGPKAGDLGVALALGPGLAVETALLKW